MAPSQANRARVSGGNAGVKRARLSAIAAPTVSASMSGVCRITARRIENMGPRPRAKRFLAAPAHGSKGRLGRLREPKRVLCRPGVVAQGLVRAAGIEPAPPFGRTDFKSV